MTSPHPTLRPAPRPAPQPHLRLIPREDPQWDRPIFKAPPLRLPPPVFDASAFGAEIRRDCRIAG